MTSLQKHTLLKAHMPSPTCPRHTGFFLTLACLTFNAASQTQASEDPSWRFTAGMGVMSQPKYPGSSESRVGIQPTFSASHGRWQIGAVPGTGVPLGVNYSLLQDGPWRLGIGLGTSLGASRQAKDDSNFARLGTIEQTTWASVSGSYAWGAVTTSASIMNDVGGHQQGTRAQLDVMYRTRATDRLSLSMGPGLTWMDSRYANTYYGVNADQSANSGYTTYKAAAGVNALRLSAGADYQLTHDWSLSAKLGLTQLQGDAATSPTVEKKNQTSYGLFAHYRF